MINILQKLSPDDIRSDFSQGELRLNCEIVSKRAEVMAKFTGFRGSGWLCTAERQNIIIFAEDSPPPAEAGGEWPLWGEAVKGAESLHLRRYDTGWQITTITKFSSSKGILLHKRLLARSGPPFIYEISCTPQEINGVAELRQTSYRFVGFLPQSGE